MGDLGANQHFLIRKPHPRFLRLCQELNAIVQKGEDCCIKIQGWLQISQAVKLCFEIDAVLTAHWTLKTSRKRLAGLLSLKSEDDPHLAAYP